MPKTSQVADSDPARVFHVVGVVASAGGLDAFGQILAQLPPQSGMAFVLVPHLAPTHKSLMVALLSKKTEVPVVEIEEGMSVEADRIYVIPPNKYLTIQRGILRLSGPVDDNNGAASLDLFLRSLAEDQQELAIGVVLSGTGVHGTQGLRAIKANGGLTIAQDPATAAYQGMPEGAIATGIVDYVLPAAQIPQKLLDYTRHSSLLRGEAQENVDDKTQHLGPILSELRQKLRLDFGSYRKNTLLRRIDRRMILNHVQSTDDYLRLLRENDGELKRLAKDLLISVTNFFRDPEAVRVLESEVLPRLVGAKKPQDSLRVWVPAAATGEEPYSLAMLCLDELAREQKDARLQIFATDVDEDALTIARQGIYGESIVSDVGSERIARYFSRVEDHSYQVTKQLREVVAFAAQNLIGDPPFSRMDLISCRNLLIYLEPEQQQKLIQLFHFALNENGYLMLGSSETIGRSTNLFEPVSKKWRIYRRIGPTRSARLDVPIFERQGLNTSRWHRESGTGSAPTFAELTEQVLLSEYAPASVLINQASQVLYFYGPTMRFLDQPTGEPTRDLLRMARPGIRAALRSLIGRVTRDNAANQVSDARLQRDDSHFPVRLTCRPLQNAPDGLFLVTFEDMPAQLVVSSSVNELDSQPMTHEMEQELDAIRADLQSTNAELEISNEDLKAANEEMTAMNEELQSVNEELETSREELQSLNEELTTVNAQLSDKVEESEAANNDLANLLNSTDSATLFLSEGDRIRRFTPAATRLFHLISSDVGRPISDLSHKFLDRDLSVDTATVSAQLTPLEREVESEDGRWYLRRILPYRTLQNRIAGVVVTFTEVTKLKRAEVALRQNQELKRLATIVIDSNDAITMQTTDGKIISWNRGAEQIYGYSEAEAIGMSLQQIVPIEIRQQEADLFSRVTRGESIRAWQTQRIALSGKVLDVDLTATPLRDDSSAIVAISTTERDITQQKAAARYMSRLAIIVASSEDAIVGKSLDGTITDWNRGAERIYGYRPDEVLGKSITILSPTSRAEEFPRLLLQVREGQAIRHFETVHVDKDKQALEVSVTISPIRDMAGAVIGAATFSRDISDRKRLERQVLAIADEERRRIGQDLHDETGQDLVGLGLIAQTLDESLRSANSPEAELSKKITRGIQRAIAHLRVLSRSLVPVEIDSGGLMAALTNLAIHIAEQPGVECTFVANHPVLVDDPVTATHLYRIAQEAIGNALKHGKPRKIEIQLQIIPDGIVLEIQDDGSGFREKADDTEGLGLRIMRHRVALINAELQINARPGSGVCVRCIVAQTGTKIGNQR